MKKNIRFYFLLSALLTMVVFLSCSRVSEETLGPSSTEVDDQGFLTLSSNGFVLKYKVEGVELHCKLTSQTSGWVSVGFNPSSMMKDANYIIGYVSGSNAFIRDDFGVSNTVHQSDVSLGGTSNLTLIGGTENASSTTLEFKIPLNSGDPYDQVLLLDHSYPVVFAQGNSDDFTSSHYSTGHGTITLGTPTIPPPDTTGVVPDTTGYYHAITGDYTFHWKTQNDSLKCILSCTTTGWVAVGFDPTARMQNANFIIGYVQPNGQVYIRDDFGVSQTAHASDISLGGSDNLANKAGKEEAGVTTISFTIPLNSGDSYDKPLNPTSTYPVIFAKGNSDDYNSLHSGTSVVNLDLSGGSIEQGITTGPDIYLDNDITGFHSQNVEGVTFKWKIINDSIRVHLIAPTTGWVAVGFKPTDEMLNANFIIGYVNNGVAYVRDDFGDTRRTHASDLSLGGSNDVHRVFGKETDGSTEIHFTIPLNSGDSFDKVLTPGNTIKIIFAHSPNNSDDFNAMHSFAEDVDITLN